MGTATRLPCRTLMADIDADPPGTFGTRQWKAAGTEFIATAMFVFVGGASVAGSGKLSADEMTVDRVIGISLCHGLAFIALSIMVRVVNMSQGDDDEPCGQGFMNPAYCLAAAATGQLKASEASAYVVAQFVGSMLGAFCLFGCVSENTTKGQGSLGGTYVQKGLSQGNALVMEFMLTFIFMYVLFSVNSENAGLMDYNGPVAAGLTMIGMMLVGVPLTGGSMNPARSFGPAIFNGQFSDQWIYWLGPIFGAVMAASMWKTYFVDSNK